MSIYIQYGTYLNLLAGGGNKHTVIHSYLMGAVTYPPVKVVRYNVTWKEVVIETTLKSVSLNSVPINSHEMLWWGKCIARIPGIRKTYIE